jgi:Beta-lactamase class C and other penicillin binding proteins
MTGHKSFCSLIVGKEQDIFYEKYAEDFSSLQPQTIMSISKMFLNLFVGELLEKGKLQLEKPISYYLPNIGSGYAEATVQNVLNMNTVNAFTEDYTDPYSTSFMHETVGGWRIPDEGQDEMFHEDFLNSIRTDGSNSVINNSENAFYKSANSDVIALLIKKLSGRKLRDWLLSSVEAMGLEDGLYMATDRGGMPWLSGGGCLIARDLLRMGLLFSRKGVGIRNRITGSGKFIDDTVSEKGPKYMHLKDEKYVYYANQTMKSNNWIGHSGYGGQFLMINLETNVVASFFLF